MLFLKRIKYISNYKKNVQDWSKRVKCAFVELFEFDGDFPLTVSIEIILKTS